MGSSFDFEGLSAGFINEDGTTGPFPGPVTPSMIRVLYGCQFAQTRQTATRGASAPRAAFLVTEREVLQKQQATCRTATSGLPHTCEKRKPIGF